MMAGSVLALLVVSLLHSTKCSCSAFCQISPNITSVAYSETIVNHTIVGPIMSSITAKNERECEMECHLAVPDMCYMFNYYLSSKVCELLYKDRAAEYKVKKKNGSKVKTRKCVLNPCLNGGQCYTLGDKTSSSCICIPMFQGSKFCRTPLHSTKTYLDAITNYTIVGPLLQSLTASSEASCECKCQWYDQDMCYMFNYYPSSKVCELFHKDRPAEYKMEKKEGSTFKAPKCEANPCLNGGKCLSFAQNMTGNEYCFCETMFNGTLCQNPTCTFTSSITPYANAILNYSIVGSILWSFTATNESACECACNEKDQGLCYSFNYNPSTKFCELLYKDTAAKYSVVQKPGSTFKARKCNSNPCLNEGKCFVLGNQNKQSCLCHPLFTGPKCAKPICKTDPNVPAIQYTASISNYSISGPILRSFTTINEMACECTCQMMAQGLCYMFNYNPLSKMCSLLYNDRATEYSVSPQPGMMFKTRKCVSNPCYTIGGECYSLGDGSGQFCLCKPNFNGKYCHIAAMGIQVNTAPVCIGATGDNFGTFVAPFDGKVKTFRLVHLSGGVAHIGGPLDYAGLGNWGTKAFFFLPLLRTFPMKIELHVTDENNARITPPLGYPLDMDYDRMGYDLSGYTNMSPELIFPEISPQITVKKGQRFRIWFGQDLANNFYDIDNLGTTCADAHIYYTE
ncbi:neurogenic locus notch homolog protein 1-like isoform X2 [Actinia tenebrosa]|uniref:Neurogenic locus notch homolog protein 1-like isoform X2 n=1 Tax=Actinia tenebrosa TaxID=6105 RepID=A0A6P8IU01_ACTTE|nr:neurogenic locus notch homolog protein 1-like isoform X2 [Actinia tenebrosa]